MRTLILSIAASLAAFPALAQVCYRVTSIPLPPSLPTGLGAVAINNAVEIAGRCYERPGDFDQSFFWSPSRGPVALGLWAGGYVTYAMDINDAGQIVGYADGNGSHFQRAFRWSPETGYVELPSPPGSLDYSEAAAINNAGFIAGMSWASGTTVPVYWDTENNVHRLGSLGGEGHGYALKINATLEIVGYTSTSTSIVEFYWSPATGMRLVSEEFPTAIGSASDLNDTGLILDFAAGVSRVHDRSGVLATIGVPPLDYGGIAINNLGTVCGDYGQFPFGPTAPFVWDFSHGFRDLRSRMDPCTPPGDRENIWMADINDLGQMCGGRGGEPLLFDPYIAADTDLDGDTDLFDLAVVLTHFGEAGEEVTYEIGDVDEDFDVDLDDLAHVLIRFGSRCP
jgi:probable HAF family extracellular repeat protein